MKRICLFKRIIALALLMCILSLPTAYAVGTEPDEFTTASTCIISDEEYYPEGYSGYIYPVRPGTSEWYALDDHSDMIEVCTIPENILSSMTTGELMESILAYPLIVDMFAYDDWSVGFQVVASRFNGLQEFLNRSDSPSALVNAYATQETLQFDTLSDAAIAAFNREEGSDFLDADYKSCRTILASMVLNTMLCEDSLSSRFTVADKAQLLSAVRNDNIVSMKHFLTIEEEPIVISTVSPERAVSLVEHTGYAPYPISITTVSTPHGTAVDAYTTVCAEVWLGSDGNSYVVTDALYSDLPASYITTLNNAAYTTFGLRPIEDPTVTYNCHAYAWYEEVEDTPYWINDPSAYLTDGSYEIVTKLNTSIGDRVVYYWSYNSTYQGIQHSAIIESYTSPSASTRTLTLVSKWGIMGLYRHSVYTCPYYDYVDDDFDSHPYDIQYFTES